MAWHLRRMLSLDEFSLLMADLDPSEVGSVQDALFRGWANKEAADAWLRLITESIMLHEFPEEECRLVEYDDFRNDTFSTTVGEVGFHTRLCTASTRISRKALRQWLINSGSELPDFLSNSLLPAPIQESPSFQELNKSPISDELQAVDDLLNRRHQFQSDELATAIRAWLAVANLCAQNLNSASSIKKEVADWLEDKAPEMSAAQKERIALMVNWDKTGGRPGRG